MLLITVSTLSIFAFLLAAAVMHRLEVLTHIAGSLTVHLRQEPISISLQAVAIAGLVVSIVLWLLVAIATPLPGLVSGLVQQRLPSGIRQRFTRRHGLIHMSAETKTSPDPGAPAAGDFAPGQTPGGAAQPAALQRVGPALGAGHVFPAGRERP